MFSLLDAGRSVTLEAGKAPLPAMQAECDCAQMMTVVLTRADQGAVDPTLTLVRVVAQVSWGCGGISGAFDVDWMSGATFSLVADRVTVNGVYLGDAAGDRTPAQVVQASLVLGTRPSAGSPRRTVELGSVAAGATVTVPIPERASAVGILSDSDVGYGRYLFQIRSADQVAALNVMARASPTLNDRVPIPNGARALSVTNSRGAGPDRLHALFYLDV